MADFRKWLLAFAAVALLFGLGSSTAYAQGMTCNASGAVSHLVRAEGVAELMGDLVLTCTGGVTTLAGQHIKQSDVQVSLNTYLTSRIVGTVSGFSISEALLTIDEPYPSTNPYPDGAHGGTPQGINASSNQMACLAINSTNCDIISTGVGLGDGGSYSGVANSPAPNTGNHYNVFQGFQSAAQAVSWNGVPIDAPGTAGTRIIRITNIRGNACYLGVSSTLVPTQIYELVGITGSQGITINNPNQVVAVIVPGLSTKVTSGPSVYQQCTSLNSGLLDGSSVSGSTAATLAVTEGYGQSFKSANYAQTISATYTGTYTSAGTGSLQNILGFAYNTESGFVPDPAIGSAGGSFVDTGEIVGQATQGTQFQVAFSGIGAGVNLFVPTYIYLTGAYGNGAVLGVAVLAGQTAPPVVAAPAVGSAAPLAQLTVTGTTASALYEIYYADASVTETLPIPVTVAYISNTASNLPATGSGQAAVNFAPLSTIATASAVAPIPRFCQPYTPVTIYTINPCTCDLLFPFVTNQGGFDTGVAIANTSQDPFGTTPQQGNVTLNYYGGTSGGGAAPPAQTTNAVVPAGQELIFTLSNGGNFGIQATPGFQGYIISVANFQYCHAFAFISDVGAQRLAEGYLAIQLDVPFNLQYEAPATGSRTGNFGENDGN